MLVAAAMVAGGMVAQTLVGADEAAPDYEVRISATAAPSPAPSAEPEREAGVTLLGPVEVEPGETDLDATPFRVEVVHMDCREDSWTARVGLTSTADKEVPGAGLVVEVGGQQARGDVFDVPPGGSVHTLKGDGACPHDAGEAFRSFLAWCA